MIEEFTSHVYYIELDNADGFYRNLPGYPSYICLNSKFKGDTDKTLDGLVVLLEARAGYLHHPSSKTPNFSLNLLKRFDF